MASWAVAKAKAKFSEVIETAQVHGAQEITRNGKLVGVPVSPEEWKKANHTRAQNARTTSDFFRNSPLVSSGLDLRRSRTRTRKTMQGAGLDRNDYNSHRETNMAWAATEAKAKFSEVLDRAETYGPQLVTRRKQEFVVITKDDFTKRTAAGAVKKPFVSAWDAMKPSFTERFDIDFPRLRGRSRKVNFE